MRWWYCATYVRTRIHPSGACLHQRHRLIELRDDTSDINVQLAQRRIGAHGGQDMLACARIQR